MLRIGSFPNLPFWNPAVPPLHQYEAAFDRRTVRSCRRSAVLLKTSRNYCTTRDEQIYALCRGEDAWPALVGYFSENTRLTTESQMCSPERSYDICR